MNSILRKLAHRLAITDLERPHRRDPAQADTGRRAQIAEAELLVLAPHVAGVEITEQAQRAIVARARHWDVELGVQVDLAVAADVGPGHVDRAQRALVEAPHRAKTTTVEVFEDRIRAPAETLAVAGFGIESERVLLRQRDPLLDLVVGAQVAGVERHAPFGVEPLVEARGRDQRAVAAVALPAECQRQAVGDVAKGLAV